MLHSDFDCVPPLRIARGFAQHLFYFSKEAGVSLPGISGRPWRIYHAPVNRRGPSRSEERERQIVAVIDQPISSVSRLTTTSRVARADCRRLLADQSLDRAAIMAL